MRLPRPVWMLGWVSFFTDTASEMIYPLLPLFLTRVLGASAMSLGVIEGAADAANSVLKIVSGRLADHWGAPKPLVVAGYAISSAVRPFIGFASTWLQVLGLRFVDRLGKGIRGAPRDAMLATFADASNRGKVFGFHRAMDHAGAVCGPLIASAFLFFYPGDYRTLFALTIVPGLVVVLILLRVPPQGSDLEFQPPQGSDLESQPRPGGDIRDLTPAHSSFDVRDLTPAPSPRSAPLPGRFYKAMFVIVLFSLGNASDAFLLLRFADVGITAFWIPFLWSALHVVKTGSSLVGGQWSDRFGRRRMLALGWLVYAGVYLAFAIADAAGVLVTVFLIYGLHFGLTEGVEKAWVADLAPPPARGTAFGIYNAVLGAGSLAASLLFGAIWTRVSPAAAFVTGASFALAASALLYLMFSPGQGSARRDA